LAEVHLKDAFEEDEASNGCYDANLEAEEGGHDHQKKHCKIVGDALPSHPRLLKHLGFHHLATDIVELGGPKERELAKPPLALFRPQTIQIGQLEFEKPSGELSALFGLTICCALLG